jgi:hypothetical protein
MLYPYHLVRQVDWPDLAACRAPWLLLVHYDSEGVLFTPEGMQAAHDARAGILRLSACRKPIAAS